MVDIDPRWAWEPYRPSAQNPWDLKKAGHLYRRAAFGASWQELELAVRQGPEKTIDSVLKGGPDQEAFERQMTGLLRNVAAGNNDQQARAWWLFRILYTPHPLREKLTLFWHNHFATSNGKVNNVGYMLGQNELIRKHALGRFSTFLQEMSKDPAMMIYLDTQLSKKGMPNENYARELMELFSLGRGNYTEDDVKAGARAFTGWEIKQGKFHFNPDQHDNEPKTFLGRTGNFGGEDVVKICLEQKSCPYFITGKLFRFFISETLTPSNELLEPLATRFRQSDFDIAEVVTTMLRSNLFFSSHAYRARVKSPTDFAVGIARALEPETVIEVDGKKRERRMGTLNLADALEGLGQRLLSPPSVKGWDGGTAWINSTSLLLRQNLALALTSTEDDRFGSRLDAVPLARVKYGKRSDEEVVEFFINLFLQGDLAADSRTRLHSYMAKTRNQPYPVYWTQKDVEDHRIRAVCHLVLTQPEFQLA